MRSYHTCPVAQTDFPDPQLPMMLSLGIARIEENTAEIRFFAILRWDLLGVDSILECTLSTMVVDQPGHFGFPPLLLHDRFHGRPPPDEISIPVAPCRCLKLC